MCLLIQQRTELLVDLVFGFHVEEALGPDAPRDPRRAFALSGGDISQSKGDLRIDGVGHRAAEHLDDLVTLGVGFGQRLLEPRLEDRGASEGRRILGKPQDRGVVDLAAPKIDGRPLDGPPLGLVRKRLGQLVGRRRVACSQLLEGLAEGGGRKCIPRDGVWIDRTGDQCVDAVRRPRQRCGTGHGKRQRCSDNATYEAAPPSVRNGHGNRPVGTKYKSNKVHRSL